MWRRPIQLLTAFLLTVSSVWIHPLTDERAMYGHDGPVEQNWRPRTVAGWPAPFLADNPHTSVIHQIGPEDNFRPESFLATFSFWLLATLALFRLQEFWRSRHGS